MLFKWSRSGPLGLLIMTLMAGPVLADPVTPIKRAPFDARAINVDVDQRQLAGLLAPDDLMSLVEAGRVLFDAKFTTADGAGRPLATQAAIPTLFKHAREVHFQRASGPDANSCTSCHNDPIDGGAGDFTANVFTSEGTESADFDNVDPQFSNERGTNHLFGSGLLELLAREMTADLHNLRTAGLRDAQAEGRQVKVDLISKGVSFGSLLVAPDGTMDISGVEGIDADLIVRPFSQKGVTPSLRMFTLNALNAHFGMQADERFSLRMTGMADFDGDGMEAEFAPGLVSAMVAYQATLDVPETVTFDNPDWQAAADRGAALFADTGCAACHVPALPLRSLKFADPGPYDTAGTLSSRDVAEPAVYDLALLDWAENLERNEAGEVMVPLFGDLKRHQISDGSRPHFGNELLSQGFVPRDSFMTSELWGVADTPPFGHRGDVTTLFDVIALHGGEGTASADAFSALQEDEQNDLVTFLMTLRTPQ